ncbi:MAG: hypothetical protein ACON5A_03850 [Candidatus Comchoanobacterales bacterium]
MANDKTEHQIQIELKSNSINNISIPISFLLKLKLKRLLAKYIAKFIRYGLVQIDLERKILELKDAEANEISELKDDFYSEEVEVGAWNKYKRVINGSDSRGLNIKFHHNLLISEVSNLIENEGFEHVINFGVSYAGADAKLANQYPNVAFIGVDRSPVAKSLNEAEFVVSNLEFHAIDILEFIEKNKSRMANSLFIHQRTATFLNPKLLSLVYSSCYDAGCKTILGIEPIGYCHSINGFYNFSFNQQASQVLRKPLMVHNYPNILYRNGFSIERIDALEYPHELKDMRAIRIIANRAP